MNGRLCPGCGTDLSGAHRNRVWCSERCRKSQYGGNCETCGATTCGNDGRANAPTHCSACAPRAHARWSRERLVEKVREWVAQYGVPPTPRDWNPGLADLTKHPDARQMRRRFEAGDWPVQALANYYFDSWDAMLEMAGAEPIPSGDHHA